MNFLPFMYDMVYILFEFGNLWYHWWNHFVYQRLCK